MTGLCVVAYFHYLPQGIDKARTCVFIIMAFTQLFNMRSLSRSVFDIGIFSNKYINLALVIATALQFVVIEAPFFAGVFAFEPVRAEEFLLFVAVSSGVLWIGELYKWGMRRRRR